MNTYSLSKMNTKDWVELANCKLHNAMNTTKPAHNSVGVSELLYMLHVLLLHFWCELKRVLECGDRTTLYIMSAAS